MRILHLTPFFSPNVGGVETHLDDLLTYLDKKNHKVYVVTYQPLEGAKKGKSYEKRRNVEIIRINWFRGLYYKTLKYPIIHFLLLTPGLFAASAYYLLTGKIDKPGVIHAHGINAGFSGVFLKKLLRIPMVLSFHVVFHFSNSLMTEFFLWPAKNADKILVLTKNSKKELIRFGIDSKKIGVYSYWVDQKKFVPMDRATARKKISLPKNKFIALFVGRLVEEKGVRLILEVSSKLKDVLFVFAGVGELEKEVINAQKLRNVEYLGRVDNDELPSYYNSADVLVVPSLVKNPRPTFEEGIPRVIIEALSCGIPIIGTDNGGVKEVIEEGNVGFIAEGNPGSIRDLLLKLKSGIKVLNEIKRRSRKYALKRFNENRAQIILKAYRIL